MYIYAEAQRGSEEPTINHSVGVATKVGKAATHGEAQMCIVEPATNHAAGAATTGSDEAMNGEAHRVSEQLA